MPSASLAINWLGLARPVSAGIVSTTFAGRHRHRTGDQPGDAGHQNVDAVALAAATPTIRLALRAALHIDACKFLSLRVWLRSSLPPSTAARSGGDTRWFSLCRRLIASRRAPSSGSQHPDEDVRFHKEMLP